MMGKKKKNHPDMGGSWGWKQESTGNESYVESLWNNVSLEMQIGALWIIGRLWIGKTVADRL